MQPTLARPPFDRDGWIYEEKVDGWRMLAYKDGARVRLISRSGVDHTARFPDLGAAIAKLHASTLVLDGEVAVFDKDLVSRFHLLGEPNPAELCTPPTFIAFDVLQVERRDVWSLPLLCRRAMLEDQLGVANLVLPVRRLDGDGAAAWTTVQAHGYEGLMTKDPTSTYREGPTRAWVKVKVRREGVFPVGGIAITEDGFAGALVGRRQDGELRYVGTVEFGYSKRLVGELLSHASGLAGPTSPFADLRTRRGVTWLEPQLVAHVTYAEIVGGRLRPPSGAG